MRLLSRHRAKFLQRPSGTDRRPWCATAWSKPVIAAILLLGIAGCSLRTYPPIKYVPLLGAEKKITTTVVLAQALKDRDVNVRAQAVELLGILGQSSDEKIKKNVARVLGTTLRDLDPGIRLQAVEKLGKMEEKYGNKYLLAALRDPNPFVREKVLQELQYREQQSSQPQTPGP